MPQQLSWLGSQFTLYPPVVEGNLLNITSGIRAVNARLLHLLLMHKGDDPIHPQYGFAADLFAPKSNRDPDFYAFQLTQLLTEINQKAKIGLESFRVDVVDEPTSSSLEIKITYVPIFTKQHTSLAFGFWEYLEAFQGNNLSDYINSIRYS